MKNNLKNKEIERKNWQVLRQKTKQDNKTKKQKNKKQRKKKRNS